MPEFSLTDVYKNWCIDLIDRQFNSNNIQFYLVGLGSLPEKRKEGDITCKSWGLIRCRGLVSRLCWQTEERNVSVTPRLR